jgi:hypothetical protein
MNSDIFFNNIIFGSFLFNKFIFCDISFVIENVGSILSSSSSSLLLSLFNLIIKFNQISIY